MRNLPVITALYLVALPAAAFELDWSWEDGFFGDSIDGDVFVDDGTIYPGYLCDICRDPDESPLDFAAIAYNGYWGDNPWMLESRLGMPFRVYNLDLEWVAVWFEDLIFDAPSMLPDTMDIRVRLQNGQILTFTVLQGGPDMPVGDPDPSSTSCDCGAGDGGGGEGDDDYADIDEYEWPEEEVTGNTGVVEIIDPDEDGEFPDWIEEL